jgi:serine/threonine protein kinase
MGNVSITQPTESLLDAIHADDGYSVASILNSVDEPARQREILNYPLTDKDYQTTALIRAVLTRSVNVVEYLLSAKDSNDQPLVDVNEIDTEGNTAILAATELAAKSGDAESRKIFKMILSFGANPLLPKGNSIKPLMVAMRHGRFPHHVVGLLLYAAINFGGHHLIHAKSNDNHGPVAETALSLAIKRGLPAVAGHIVLMNCKWDDSAFIAETLRAFDKDGSVSCALIRSLLKSAPSNTSQWLPQHYAAWIQKELFKLNMNDWEANSTICACPVFVALLQHPQGRRLIESPDASPAALSEWIDEIRRLNNPAATLHKEVKSRDYLSELKFDLNFMDMKLEAEPISRGSTCLVYRASLDHVAFPVVAKRIYFLQTRAHARELKNEIELMKRFAVSDTKHDESSALLYPDHVLQYAGVCYSEPHIYLMTELLEHGDLHTFLVRTKHYYPVILPNSREQPYLRKTVKLLIEAAKGVVALHSASPPVIHRDIALRNFLVGADEQVKICDLGMARDMRTDDAYDVVDPETAEMQKMSFTFTNRAATRWLAPECFAETGKLFFSPKTDVWAFAISMWEAFYRTTPYERECPHREQVFAYVQEGKRLHIDSKTVPRQIGQLMKTCWNANPASRPTMLEVLDSLQQAYDNLDNFTKTADAMDTLKEDKLARHGNTQKQVGSLKQEERTVSAVGGDGSRPVVVLGMANDDDGEGVSTSEPA